MRIMILLCIVSLFIGDVHAQASTKLVPRPKSKGEYIILKDSTKLTGNVYRSGDGIKLDGKYYEYSQLLGYKENSSYHAVLNDGLYDVWATGKIQAYSHWMTTGTGLDYNPHSATPQGKWTTSNRHTNFCYLKKADGQPVPYTSQNLHSLISDNEAAVTVFNKYYKKLNQKNPLDPFYEHLKKVLAAYNGGEFTEY